jgi:DNA-binding PadR family transcriptional regulator
MRELTELEGCVLGHVWEKGPCTAYALRQMFLGSASPHWSGSAGAIYPLVQRLARQGLLRARDQATGRRRSKGYVLTPAGFARFLRWLGPPLSEETVGVPMDPLRTRFYFLGALKPEQRAQFLVDAEAKMQDHLARLEKAGRQSEGLYDALANRGSVVMMKARLAWLRGVSEEASK